MIKFFWEWLTVRVWCESDVLVCPCTRAIEASVTWTPDRIEYFYNIKQFLNNKLYCYNKYTRAQNIFGVLFLVTSKWRNFSKFHDHTFCMVWWLRCRGDVLVCLCARATAASVTWTPDRIDHSVEQQTIRHYRMRSIQIQLWTKKVSETHVL